MSDLSTASDAAGRAILLKTVVRKALDKVASHGTAFHRFAKFFHGVVVRPKVVPWNLKTAAFWFGTHGNVHIMRRSIHVGVHSTV
jgi:hypothetical protein